MQAVENDFLFLQNRWIADPYSVDNNSLLISLSGTLDGREGKSVDLSLRKMDDFNWRKKKRPSYEQKPVRMTQNKSLPGKFRNYYSPVKECYLASVLSSAAGINQATSLAEDENLFCLSFSF